MLRQRRQTSDKAPTKLRQLSSDRPPTDLRQAPTDLRQLRQLRQPRLRTDHAEMERLGARGTWLAIIE